MSKLGKAPKRGVKKNMLAANSPKDKKLVNFEATSDQIKIWKNFCTDNNVSMKELFTEGAKIYIRQREFEMET
tara:strand:+ start:870 stop:1088 length:219 start_codon:yes stop_codon:yes gene_type:complete